MIKALSLCTEVIQVSQPLCARTQVATEAEGLHTKALSRVLPGADEFHHQELRRQGMRGVRETRDAVT